MCISPIRIPNPNAGMQKTQGRFHKDCSSKFIEVPCHHCPECIKTMQMGFVQRIQMESLDNHLFMATLTYNNEMLPRITTSTGYDIRYADVEDVKRMFKRLRKRDAFGRPFRHFTVSELGSKRARPHFHILFIISKYETDTHSDCLNLENVMFREVLKEWCRNVGSTKSPVYKPCCTYVRSIIRGKVRTNYDLHYVNPNLTDGGVADVGFYVLKYMLKPDEHDRPTRLRRALKLNLSEEEYKSTWSLVKPRHFQSLGFGLGRSQRALGDHGRKYFDMSPKVRDYVRQSVSRSKSDFPSPRFFNPVDGKPFPLSRYYQTFAELYSVDDALDFFENGVQTNRDKDNVVIHDDVHVSQLLKKEDDFRKIQKMVSERETALELNDLFDDE